MWRIAIVRNWKDMNCPVLSRWEHVGEAVQHMVTYTDQWMSMSRYIIAINNVGKNKCDSIVLVLVP